MPDRKVKLGSLIYVDEDGKTRRGEEGETVKVHSDHVEKFDALNVLFVAAPPPEEVPDEDEKPDPRSRTRRAPSAS